MNDLSKAKKNKVVSHEYLYAEIGCVDLSFRKSGVAKEMTSYCFNEADKLNIPVLAETSDKATLSLWEKLGYEVYAYTEPEGYGFWHLCRTPVT